MADKKVVIDEESAKGFDTIDLAFPEYDADGKQTHYRKAPVSKALYDEQMELPEEERNPEFRTGKFKKASSLKASDFQLPKVEVTKSETMEERINRLVDEKVAAALAVKGAKTATGQVKTAAAAIPTESDLTAHGIKEATEEKTV